MIDRSKYSLNGVYRCENLSEKIRRNNFSRVPIGSAGGISGWYIILRILEGSDPPVLYPFICCNNKPTLLLRRFYNIIKEDRSSCFTLQACRLTAPKNGPIGYDMRIMDLMNEENGYLDDNGGLTVEYGIHVDAILRDDGIWKFNLNDQFFNSENTLAIKYKDSDVGRLKTFYGHKQLLRFHSPHFQNQLTKLARRRRHEKWIIEECLQIAHGVRIPLETNVLKIASLAHDNNLRNVVQYADQQLVVVYWSLKITEIKIFLFENCIKFGLRHYLAHLVNHFECLEDLEDIIKQLNIEKMSGEAMKTFAAKIFYLGT